MTRTLTLLLLLAAAPAAAQSHVLIVSGLGGEPRYEESFHRWAVAMADAARARSVPDASLTLLTEDPARDPGRIDGRATREAVLQVLRETAERAGPRDGVFILLIGHGSSDGAGSRLNLPGPDLTAADLAGALEAFETQPVAVVNAASASGDFIGPLSGRNRTIVTATSSGFEQNETVFAGYFVDAYTGDGADVDKDGRVSLLEAFDYARREVARRYEQENRLLTEHALLDDNADGKGTAEPDGRNGDGGAARRFFLAGGASAGATADSPELRALLDERRRLEGQVEALKARKATLPQGEYEVEMERLLLELARVGREIRERGGGG